MNLKVKKYIFSKISIYIAIVFALLMSTYMVLSNLLQDSDRMPASYTLHTTEIESRSKKMIEEGRRLHIIEDYKSANETLSELLEKYPYTAYTEEASFLLAKGFLHEEQYQQSETVIQTLQEYNPDSRSKWMGYSFLVMAKIHEEKGKTDDAILLYRKVITEFSDEDLVNEAEDMLLSITL